MNFFDIMQENICLKGDAIMKRWKWIALLLCALLTVSVFAACETKPQAESW